MRLVISLLMLAAACAPGPSADPVGRPSEDSPIPDIDLSVAAVALDAVVFDTFDGGFVTLAQSNRDLRTRLLDAIPPIRRPVYHNADSGAWLDPDDLLIGVVTPVGPIAYPTKILDFHEIVEDTFGDTPVLITYCPLCRSGVVYDRRVGGRTLTFGNTSALYENDLVMVDHQTGSYWWQVAGRAIVGSLTGAVLDAFPSVTTTWRAWIDLHPETLVLSRDTGFQRPYERDSFDGYPDRIDRGEFPFPVSPAVRDDRLPASGLVVIVGDSEDSISVPLGGRGVVNDTVGGDPVSILVDGDLALAVDSVLDGDALSFELVDGAFTDSVGGSVWTTQGRAISGPMAGATLTALPSRTMFWFAAAAAFPSTRLAFPTR